MSGGGAGKVYFVLYLAVVLELLIIIVERDEAEEHLLKKQKESMKIVESILSQLQSGAGTEGINTRPQDEITLPPAGVNIKEVMGADIKSWRKYIVEVGVTDVSKDLNRHEGEPEKEYHERVKKLVELANVAEIEYQIFYSSSPNPDNAPLFPNDKEIQTKFKEFVDFQPGQTFESGDGEIWEFLSSRKLELDADKTYNSLDLRNITPESIKPSYPKSMIKVKGLNYCPKEVPEDSVFDYSEFESLKDSRKSGSNEIKKRAFVVYFQPPNNQGWYKLRFNSRTNRILGVRADIKPSMIDKETKINIGTVQLTVEALEKVKKELQSKLEKYSLPPAEVLIEEGNLDAFNKGLDKAMTEASKEEDPTEIRGKINLYGYIVKLLAPGQSRNFDQNRGAIEFNVRVITPKPPISEPVISAPTYIASFDKVPAAFDFQISPFQGAGNNKVSGRVMDINNNVVARLSLQAIDQIAGSDVPKPTNGSKQEWRAILDQNLSPGMYSVEVTHQLYSGKPKIEILKLEIFESKLTNSGEIDKLKYSAVYGQKIRINAIPTSGGKIKSNQFRVYLNTDIDQQAPPFEGLAMDNFKQLSSKAKELTVEITWIQPGTNKEIVLFEKKTFPITQKKPSFNSLSLKSESSSEDGKKIKVVARDIEITFPQIGTDEEVGKQKPKIEIKVKNGSKDDLKGGAYEWNGEPTFEMQEGDRGVTISLRGELSGNLERGVEEIRGSVSIQVQAYAINPINGQKSEAALTTINIPVKAKIEKSGGRRPAGGGGGSAPKPGGGAPPSGGKR